MIREGLAGWLLLVVLAGAFGAAGSAEPAAAEMPQAVVDALAALAAQDEAPPEGADPQADSLPPPPSPSVAEPDPVRLALEAAWRLPTGDLDERVRRVLRAGMAFGLRNLEGPARALLLDERAGPARARARAAVRLAPDLPAARFALARALWREGEWNAARTELHAGVARIPRHLEAWLWARAAVLTALALAAVGGALLFLGVAGSAALPRAVRDLGGVPFAWPAPSRLAAVAGLLLLPAVLGEGALGVALALGALAFAYGSPMARVAVAGAAALLWVGLHPLLERAADAQTALSADPVAEAAWAVERGLASGAELARVEHAAGGADALAARAFAVRRKREGAVVEADGRFAALLDGADPSLLNNAAVVRLAAGRPHEAIDLYEAAAAAGTSAAVLFNLSQAYGRVIQLEEQNLALAEAQEIDPEVVADLTDVFGDAPEALAVDLPVPVGQVMERLHAPGASRTLAASWRRRLAPGVLGGAALPGAVGFGAALLLGALAGVALRRLSDADGDDYYAGMARLLQRRGGDSSGRMERLAQLRARQARLARIELVISCVVPAAAGVLGRRPVLGLLAAFAFAAAASAWSLRAGTAPDPLAVGAGAVWIAAAGATLALAFGLLATGLALALRERG